MKFSFFLIFYFGIFYYPLVYLFRSEHIGLFVGPLGLILCVLAFLRLPKFKIQAIEYKYLERRAEFFLIVLCLASFFGKTPFFLRSLEMLAQFFCYLLILRIGFYLALMKETDHFIEKKFKEFLWIILFFGLIQGMIWFPSILKESVDFFGSLPAAFLHGPRAVFSEQGSFPFWMRAFLLGKSYYGGAFSTLGHENIYAPFLELVSPFLFYKILTEKTRWKWFKIGLILLGSFLILSRTIYMIIPIELGIMVLWIQKENIWGRKLLKKCMTRFQKSITPSLLLARGMFTLILCLFLYILISSSPQQNRAKTPSSRKIIYQVAIQGVWQSPFWGWGPSSYKPYLNSLSISIAGVDHSHNILLETLFSGGIIGFLAGLPLLWGLIHFFFETLLATKNPAVFSCFLGSGFFFLHNQIDMFFYSFPLGFFFFLIFGFGLSLNISRSR